MVEALLGFNQTRIQSASLDCTGNPVLPRTLVAAERSQIEQFCQEAVASAPPDAASYSAAVARYPRNPEAKLWVSKPVDGSFSSGVRLVNLSSTSIAECAAKVLQGKETLKTPLLLQEFVSDALTVDNGCKVEIRFHVMIARVRPC